MTATPHSMTVGDLVGKILGEGNPDFLKQALMSLVDQFMTVEVDKLVGAGKHERSDERINQRNGTRPRRWDTCVGTLELAIPKLRKGAYFPSFLEPRQRAEQAFVSIIQEAYVHGVSTRKVEDLVQAMGVESLSKSEVGGVCHIQGYFEGPTFRQILRDQGPLEREAVLVMLRSGLELLSALHASEPPVIHRDLKPANMVCLSGGEVALIDFGIARIGTRDKYIERVKDLTQAHTVGYAPPEQVIGLEAFPVADTYALAATVMYLLTGVHPIRLWDAQVGRLVPPQTIDAPLASVLTWMTAPAVADRCPSAKSALLALSRLC